MDKYSILCTKSVYCYIGSKQCTLQMLPETGVLLLGICAHIHIVGAMEAFFIPGSVFPFQHGSQPWIGKTTQLYRISTHPQGLYSHGDGFLLQITAVVWSSPVALYSHTSHLSQSLLIPLLHSLFLPRILWLKLFLAEC